MRRPRQWRVKKREACFEDYSQLAALQARNGLAVRSYEQWASAWRCNPVYKRWGDQYPIGWVLEAEDGELVGSIGNLPLAYHFRGRELRAAAACAWVVDTSYRGHSMSLLNCFTTQKNVDFVVSTTVNSRSEPALRVFQWSKAPVGRWHKSAFWITDYRGFVKNVLRMKSVPLAEVLSYPLSAALFCRDRLKDPGLRGNDAACEIEMCPDFDGRFDEFWGELKLQNNNVVLAQRDRETLAWHFQYSKMRQNVWILTKSRGSRLVAYAIFDRKDDIASGLKCVRLVDFQALNGWEQALRPALNWMLRK